MAISGKVRKIVAEDINFGTEQVVIERADGTTVNASQVNSSHIPTSEGRSVDAILKGIGYSIDEFDGLADAVAKIGSKEATLVIHKPMTLNQDLTIPENICLKFLKGGKITVNDGYTLTVNGAIEAGLWQIFDGDIVGNPKVEMVYPEWFGAVGDGVNDDTEALIRAFKFKNICCIGTYSYSSELYLSGNLYGGIFIPKSESNSAIIVDSKSDLCLDGITIKGSSENRYTVTTSCGIVVRYSERVQIRNCKVDGVGGAGIFVFNSEKIVISENNVSNTKADGIHITHASSEIFVSDNIVSGVGDDGIAVVSYVDDGDVCSNVYIHNNSVSGNNARGISVVGGKNIKIHKNSITNSYGPNIYIASEASYNTYGCENIVVSQNYCDTFSNTNFGGSIQVSDGNSVGITDVKIIENTILNSIRSGIVLIYGKIDSILISGNYINKVGETGINIIDCYNVSINNNTIQDALKYGIFVGVNVNFSNVSFNLVRNANISGESYIDSITVNTNALIMGNLTNSPNSERAIECSSKAIIRDNINADDKPILSSVNNIINEKSRRIVVLDSQPTSGVWNSGDVILKEFPVEDDNNMVLYGWICVDSGDFSISGSEPVFKPLYISTVSPAQ